MRTLRLAVLAFLLLPLLAVTWLLSTDTGTRYAAEQAQRWVPGLAIADIQGSLVGPLELQGLRFENEGVTVTIDRLRLQWTPRSLLRGRLRVLELQAGTVEVTLRDTPDDEEPQKPVTEPPLGLRLRQIGVDRLRLQLAGAKEPLEFQRIELDLRWVGPRIELRRLAAIVPQAGALLADGSVKLGTERIEIERLQLRGPGQAVLAGYYDYAGEFDAKLDWQDLRWPLQGAAQYRSPKGEATASGSLQAYRYRVEGRLAEARAAIDLLAMGEGSGQGVTLQKLEARGLGGRLDAKARVQWSPQLDIDAEGLLKNIHPEQLMPELAGVVNGRFRVQTRPVDGQPQIDFKAELFDSLWRKYRLDLLAEGRYAKDTLTLARAELRSGPTRLTASGRVWPTLDAKAELDSSNLAPLWPGLGGRVQAQLKAQGPVEGPRVQATVQAQALRYQTVSLGSLQLQADGDLRGDATQPQNLKLRATVDGRELAVGETLRAARLNLDSDLDLRAANRLRLTVADAVAAGVRAPKTTLELDGTLSRHQLRATLDSERGDVELAVRGGADLAQRRWRGELASGRLAPVDLAAWTLETPAALQLSAGEQTLEPACWSSSGARACLRLLRNARQQRIAFRLEDFAFAYLQPFLPKGWKAEGTVGGDGQLDFAADGRMTLLRADLATTAGSWTVNERRLIEFQPGAIRVSQDASGRLRAYVDLPFAQGVAHLEATLGPGAELTQRPLGGQLRIELPELTWLRLFTTEVTSVEGSIGGQFRLGGTLARPLVQGELALRDGKLRLATPGIEISNIRGTLRGGSEGMLDLDIGGSSGGGEIRIAGRIDPRSQPVQADIRISGKDFQAARIPSARIWITPDLKLGLQKNLLKVTGEVLVPRADITPADFASGTGPSSDQIIVGRDGRPPESSGLFKLSAQIGLKLGDQVTFKGYGLTTRLGGALDIFEDSGRATRAAGEIQLIGGRYKAYGQDLSIETGKLIYNGGFITEPVLQLRAERKPTEDVTVGVSVRGTLGKPQFSVYSTPSMTQQQQLSWLILGRPMEEGNNTEGDRTMLASAALALGLSGSDFLANRVRGSIGLDEISIGAKPGETSDQARLTIGKYLSPKLYVSYGIGIFQPGNIFKLAYDLGKGFKLQTESGVEAGGDLLYTIER